MSLTQFSGKIYPDRSFSLGAVPPQKKRLADSLYDREHARQPEYDLNDKINWLLGHTTINDVKQINAENALFIKSLKSSQPKRGVYGKNGITRYGKRCVKNTCILLERKYHRSQLGFGTATLPQYSNLLLHEINGRWSEVVRRFYQKVQRAFKKKSSKFIYVSVTEIQERRFRDYSQPCPHLHFVYFARRNPSEGYILQTDEFVAIWRDVLSQVISLILREASEELKKDCMDAIANNKGSIKLEAIRVSAASYLGKYMTKGIKVIQQMKEKGWTEYPKQWWSMCNVCKTLFKNSIIRLTSDECKALYYGVEHYLHEESITWATYVYYTVDKVDYICGLVGTMSLDMYKIFSG